MSTGIKIHRYACRARALPSALALLALVSGAFAGPAYSVSVTSDSLVYEIGETARFDIAVMQNGRIFPGAGFILKATYPDGSSAVPLRSEGKGLHSFEAELAEAGEKTLDVRLLHPSSNAAKAFEAQVERFRASVAFLESLPQSVVVRMTLEGLRRALAVLEAKLDNFLAPIAQGSATIAVVFPPDDDDDEAPPDTEPPIFGESVPPYGPSFALTNDPYQEIKVEVTDEGSGVAFVLIYIGDDPTPSYMEWDGLVASYHPSEPWQEGTNTVTIVAEDNAGNAAALVLEFMVDTTPPQFISFTPEQTSNPTPTIVIVVHDEHSGIVPQLVRLYVNGALCPEAFLSDDAIFYTLTEPLPIGLHEIGVSATDYAGNEASAVFMLRILR